MMTCNHEKVVERAVKNFDWDMNDYVSQLVTCTVSTLENIDSNTAKCTECGQIVIKNK